MKAILAGFAGPWPWRYGCVRHGHRLLCTSDGHVCMRCGRYWA